MEGLFQFTEGEALVFFAVLIRFSTLLVVLPITGDRMVPGPVKLVLSLMISWICLPGLLASGRASVSEAQVWGASLFGIASVAALEALVGFALGFVSRILFDSLTFAGNMVGTVMGFASASIYDPHQESQSQVVAEFLMAVSMLLFLSFDGHHLMLKAALSSYDWVPMGGVTLSEVFSTRLIGMSSEMIRLGTQLAAPVSMAIFAVNIAFAVLARAMPQLNIMVISFSITAIIGLVVMLMVLPDFLGSSSGVYAQLGDWMKGILQGMSPAGGRSG
jgi:flagellar biosynthetic protein FliR